MRTTPIIRQPRFHAAAFTLIEILIVISLITVLMTVGSFGIKNYSKARGVEAAVPIAQGVFSQARNLAIQKGTDARVLIHADNDTASNLNRERNLRYMVVQTLEDPNETPADPSDDVWETASKGVYLPDGVYFSPNLSGSASAPDVIGGSPVRTVDILLPGQATGETSTCCQYKFNSQGIITAPAPDSGTDYDNDVPRFVIRAGTLPPGFSEPIAASGTGSKNAGGFVIWKNGRTSKFRHPDQIF